MNKKEMNNGLLETLNQIIPLFERLMNFTNDYTSKGYMKTIKVAMKKKYNVFSICLVFDLMLSAFLKECRISLVDLVLERDQDAVDCVKNAKKILGILKESKYYTLKKDTLAKIKKFLDETYHMDTRIEPYFEKGEKMFSVIEKHFQTIDTMELHQFVKGKETNEKPLYLKNINCFRTMDEAIQVMNKIPVNFISLVGIKDNNSNEYGYFAYLVKNGENIHALTDINRDIGKNGIFTKCRDVHRDLMPYVHLGEFQYIWEFEDEFGFKHILNTDKYYVARNDKDWKSFSLQELEADEILLQYFMFDYVNNLLFFEKPIVKELTHTTQTIALTYKGKTINKKQLPALVNDLNSIEVGLPDFMMLFEDVIKEMYVEHKEQRDSYHLRQTFSSETTTRKWEVMESAIENIRVKLKKEPLNNLFFEYDKKSLMTVDGKIIKIEDSWQRQINGLSSHFFGTKTQYEEYSNTVLKTNFRRMIEKEFERIIEEEKTPPYSKFLEYLISDKFKDLIIEKTMLDALSNQKFSKIRERSFRKPDVWKTNKEWEECGGSIWGNRLNWREREKNKGCIITKTRTCSYAITLRLNNLEQMKGIWGFLSEDNVPDYLKIYDYHTNPSWNTMSYVPRGVFGKGHDEIYWISKNGLKKFCKEHDINYEEALTKIIRYNDD